MNTLESIAFMISMFWRLIKIVLGIIIFVVLVVIIFNFNCIFTFFDELNISFYIKKYDLMTICSGIITGLITFFSMLYIDNLNKRRAFYHKSAEKEYDLKIRYFDLLKIVREQLSLVANVSFEQTPIFLEIDQEIFLNKLSNDAYDLFKIYEGFEDFSSLWNIDNYTEWLYLHKYLWKGIDLAIEKLKKHELNIKYSKDKKSFRCSNLDKIISSKTIYPFEKLLSKIDKKIFESRKLYQMHN